MKHLLSAVFVAAAAPLFAGSTIDPVNVELNNGAGTVSVTNVGSSAIGYEVRALDWSVASDGTDQLEGTENLVVVPPLFRLAPDQTMTLRLREVVPPSAAENAYRLEITEEPPEIEGTGVGIQMQYLTSVFSSSGDFEAAVECVKQPANELLVRNTGGTRARISEVLLDDTDITSDVSFSGRTLLANSSRVLSLPQGTVSDNVAVSGRGFGVIPCS